MRDAAKGHGVVGMEEMERRERERAAGRESFLLPSLPLPSPSSPPGCFSAFLLCQSLPCMLLQGKARGGRAGHAMPCRQVAVFCLFHCFPSCPLWAGARQSSVKKLGRQQPSLYTCCYDTQYFYIEKERYPHCLFTIIIYYDDYY